MRFKYLIILFLSLAISQSSICQETNKGKTAWGAGGSTDPSATNLTMAKFYINDIKKRGIIVRLKTNKDRIAAYRKAGNSKVADKMEETVRETNHLLVLSFITHWTYCPLYFMESQNTMYLLGKDSLIAKTYDLMRDTIIYMNHDSVYIIDYGTLMANEPDGNNTTYKDINKTEESNNPASEECLVVKDGQSKQLQSPFPYFAKVSFLNIDKRKPENPDVSYPIGKFDTAFQRLSVLAGMAEKTKEQKDSFAVLLTLSYNYILKNYTHGKFPNSVGRLNNKFIDYYCTRLDKDRNILCNDDAYYWWQRNPNIRYIESLPHLEKKSKEYFEKDPTFTKIR